VVDSVCPLVTKVHHEVKVRAGKGYRIVYVGHEGHEEAVGTMAVAPDSISRVENVAEVDALPDFDEPVALLAQTTLSHRDWEGVAEAVKVKYPGTWTPGRSDLCFATTNRQSALMAMAHRCDTIVVIGSANSSNTRALEKLAIEAGADGYFLKGCTSEELVHAIEAAARGESPISPVIARHLLKRFREESLVPDSAFQIPELADPAPTQLSDLMDLEPPELGAQDVSPREHEVLRLVAQGFVAEEIAERLLITPQAVATDVRNVYRKLQLGQRTRLALQATSRPGWA
jgi:DNA-binding NarL/FixJ family response regulator